MAASKQAQLLGSAAGLRAAGRGSATVDRPIADVGIYFTAASISSKRSRVDSTLSRCG